MKIMKMVLILVYSLVFFALTNMSCVKKKELLDNNAGNKRDTICMVLDQDINYLKVVSMLDLCKKCQGKSLEVNNSYDYSWQIYVSALNIIGFNYLDENYNKMINKWMGIDYFELHKWDVNILELPTNGNLNLMKCIDFYNSDDLNNFTDSVKNDFRQAILSGEFDSVFSKKELDDILYKRVKLNIP